MSKREASAFEGIDQDERGRKRPRKSSGGSSSVLWIVLASVGGGVLLVACVGGSLIALGLAAARKDAAASAASREVVTVGMPELVSEWKKNPLATIGKYQGKTVRFSGELEEITSNRGNQTYIYIMEPSSKHRARIYVLDAEPLKQLATCQVGSAISVDAVLTTPEEQIVGHAVKIAAR